MPDVQIHPIGVVSAPGDYKVPDAAELLLKNAYAKFDGSGAAGSYLPLLRIISDAGSTLVEAVADTTIAAGASADASWFPRVGASASAAPTGTVSWIHMHGLNVSVPSQTTPHTFVDFSTAIVYTNDTSTFTILPGTGLVIHAAGFYTATVTALFTGQVAAGSAEAVFNISGIGIEIEQTDTFMKPDFAGGTAICTMTESFPLDSSGSNSSLSLIQTCGITASVDYEVSVTRATSDQGDF